MSSQIQAVVSLLAAIALIVQAAFLVESARAWGQRRNLGDIPAGVLLGVIAVAQMFHPLEPIDGVIIDLRLIPLFLCAAFLSVPSTLIAVAMAAAMRIGIGGVGMESGLMAIILAGVIGQSWAALQKRYQLARAASLILLGQMCSLSLVSAFLLPPDIRTWFLSVAGLPLALAYMTLVPTLAFILVARIGFEQGTDRTRREALKFSGVEVMSRAAFFRHLRLAAVDDTDRAPIGLMSVTPEAKNGDLGRRGKDDMIETTIKRLGRDLPGFQYTSVTEKHAILIPIYQDQFSQLSQLAEVAYDAVSGSRMAIPGSGDIWVKPKIGLVQCTQFDDPDLRHAEPMTLRLLGTRKGRTRPDPADMLFAKAGLLFDGGGRPN